MRWGTFAAVAATAVVIAGQAAAAVMTITYRGTVGSGFDTTGVFGTAGANLAGLSFVAAFRTDTLTPGATTTLAATASSIEGNAPPPVTGTFTLNGVTFVLDGDYGAQFQADDGSVESFQHYASNHVSSFDFAILFAGGFGTGADFLAGPDFRTFGATDFAAVPHLFGSFNTHAEDDAGVVVRDATANLDVLSVGLPEPQGWALMIAGFSGIGAMLRRRARAAA
jgi:hypothetical protein